jgi:hypothetical protein
LQPVVEEKITMEVSSEDKQTQVKHRPSIWNERNDVVNQLTGTDGVLITCSALGLVALQVKWLKIRKKFSKLQYFLRWEFGFWLRLCGGKCIGQRREHVLIGHLLKIEQQRWWGTNNGVASQTLKSQHCRVGMGLEDHFCILLTV